MKRVVAIAMAFGVFAAFETAAQEARPVADVMAALKQHVASQCSLARARVSSSTHSLDKEQASAMVKMSCECLPSELEQVALDLGGGKEGATTTQEAFLARMKVALSACAARLVRADILSRCESEREEALGVSDRKAYCGCVSERVRALDDASIAMAASTAHRNLQERAQARREGTTNPVPAPTAVDSIKEACKRAAQ